jgi:hypothetical protein
MREFAMRRSEIIGMLVLALMFAGEGARPPRAEAIPAFARRYQLSCTTCHAPFPRLNAFGEEFAARGYRLADAGPEPAGTEVETGDPLLHLSRDLPLAMRLEGWTSWKEKAPAESDFEFPWVVKLLSGGPLAPRISYYVYGIFEDGEALRLEDAYLQFGLSSRLPVQLIAGQFQVADPAFKRELRLERNDYAILKTTVGLAPTNLTYDRGLVLAATVPAHVEVVAEVINGAGIEAVEAGNFDHDSYKNVAGRVGRNFGPVRAGVFGYWGQEKLSTAPDGVTEPWPGNGRTSRLWYWGPDVTIGLHPKWQLALDYLERRDSDPFFTGYEGEDLVTRGGFAELHFFPQGFDGRWVLSALYNRVESDDDAADFENASLTVNRLLARNVRAALEGEHDLAAERSRVSLGFVAAF